MKYATPLTPEIKQMLQEMWRNHPISRCRQRAHGILLSVRGYTIPQIAQIFEVERRAVSTWIDNWESLGLFGLYDQPRSGRPPIFTPEETALLPKLVEEEPRQLKGAQVKIAEITGKQASCYTLKRVLKKLNYVWKRCRRSLKDKRDEVAFRKEQALQVKLHQAESNHEIRIYYFDAAGFTTTPCIPYAWQKKSETLELPSQRSKQLNILGFLNKDNDCFFCKQEGSVTSQTVIDAFEAFGQRYAEHYAQTKQPGIVIVDNAPVHTSKVFLEKIEDWYSYGLVVHFLPTYSPELNLIEILWRKMKYEWLSFDAYLSYENLKTEVLNVLSEVGRKYTITYA